MCISSIFIKTLDDSISIGFNREESPFRKFESPKIFTHKKTKIISGIDKKAGGTWFGLNEKKIFCLVTNRHKKKFSKKISRGLLLLNLLSKKTIRECLSYVQEETESDSYEGFNLIFGNTDRVFYANNIAKNIKELKKGNYYISNHLLNDKNCKRIKELKNKSKNLNHKNFKSEMKKNLESKELENKYIQRVSSNVLKINQKESFWEFSNINDEFKKWQKLNLEKLFK